MRTRPPNAKRREMRRLCSSLPYFAVAWFGPTWSPPPLALNLNVSAEVPTLSTLDAE
jgi:hypothetical protein